MINKEQLEKKAVDYLVNNISNKNMNDFKKSLSENDDFRKDFEDIEEVWEALSEDNNELETTASMDQSFYKMLHEYSDKKHTRFNNIVNYFKLYPVNFSYSKLVLAVILPIIIFVYVFHLSDSLKVDMKTIQPNQSNYLAISLLNAASFSKRIKGVNEMNKLTQLDDKEIEVMLKTLNEDTNTNIRFLTLESLMRFKDNPQIRKGLVQSLTNQESPMIQMEIIELMVSLKAEEIIKQMEILKEIKVLDPTVLEEIKKSTTILKNQKL